MSFESACSERTDQRGQHDAPEESLRPVAADDEALAEDEIEYEARREQARAEIRYRTPCFTMPKGEPCERERETDERHAQVRQRIRPLKLGEPRAVNRLSVEQLRPHLREPAADRDVGDVGERRERSAPAARPRVRSAEPRRTRRTARIPASTARA